MSITRMADCEHGVSFDDPCRECEPNRAGDEHMGAWVYCASHVGPHSTGWCTVRCEDKRPLKATNRADAVAEVKALGWRLYEGNSVYSGDREAP